MQRTAPGARLLAGAVLFTLLLAGCGEPDTSPVGLHKEAADVNGDGRVGPADAYALAGYLLKPRPGNRLGDVNADGTVDWTDLLLLGRKLAPISKAAAPPPGEPDEPENGPPTPAPAPNATGISLFVLADVTGDGRVSPADAYALLAYLLEAREPSGTIGLGNVNGDGTVNWTDLVLVGRWLSAGSPYENPLGIGQEVELPAASIEPDPSLAQFSTDGTWQSFAVRTTADSVKVVVNEPGTDAVLEIAGGSRAPSWSYCGAEESDWRRRRNGWWLHLAGCAYGHTEVVIRDYRYDVPLATYPVTIHEPPPAESFDIDLVFIDPAFTERQKTLIRQAADRWELVITEGLDDVSTVDDLRIRVGRLSEDDWAGGRAAPSAVRPNGKPFAAWMKFNRSMLAQAEDSYQWRLRHPDWIILTETAEDALENLALHEIGHCLGIAGTTSTYATSWGALVSHDGSPHFAGPLAIEAFNVAGGGSYVGEKVPLEPNANHWREAVFTNNWIMWDPAGWRWEDLIRELMSVGGGGALSAITISALADMGYRVDLAQADPYQLPPAVTTKPVAVKPVARPPTRLPWLCGGR